MARRGTPQGPRDYVTLLAESFAEHNLLTYTSAIAFQVLVALVPLTLLGLAVLGSVGLDDVWTDGIAPHLHRKLTAPLFHGVDHSVRRILHSDHAGVIVFASALGTWYLAAAVRAVMEALNKIHDVEDG